MKYNTTFHNLATAAKDVNLAIHTTGDSNVGTYLGSINHTNIRSARRWAQR